MKRRIVMAAGALVLVGAAPSKQMRVDERVQFLQALIGDWTVEFPDSVLRANPNLRDMVTHRYEWTVGGMAVRMFENVPGGRIADAELDGLIYWDPATERVQFVAVAGRREGQGRLFRGEYRTLADGGIERVYDVYYRTLADIPGEEFGGSRRRYREVFHADDNTGARHTLEWWWEGRWQPYGRGEFRMKRLPSNE